MLFLYSFQPPTITIISPWWGNWAVFPYLSPIPIFPTPFPTYFPTPFLSFIIYIMDSTSIYTFNDALSLKIRRGVDCRYRTRCIRFKEKGGLSRRTYVRTLCYGKMGYKWGMDKIVPWRETRGFGWNEKMG